MTDTPDHPQIYLVSPAEIDLMAFPDTLARCLDAVEVACVRLAAATRDAARVAKAADALRSVTHDRDVALVIDSHVNLVQPHGLDGVHLTDGARSVRAARKTLGEDAIVGAFCGNSRHDGMTAGELTADYVAFGPVGVSPLGTAEPVEPELFEWWSQMIEVPVVAEGALDEDRIATLREHTDFFALGEEIWQSDDPAGRLTRLASVIAGR